MATNITRCPKCNTSFRISDAHLNAAKGSVRCGSCLTIFRAKDHLVSASAPAAPQSITPNPKISPEQQALRQATSKLAAANMSTSSVASVAQIELKSKAEPSALHISHDPFEDDLSDEFKVTTRRGDTGEHDVSLFERDRLKNLDDDEPVEQDDSWALDLLKSEDDDSSADAPTPEQKLSKEEKAITQEFETSYTQSLGASSSRQNTAAKSSPSQLDDEFHDEFDRIDTGNFELGDDELSDDDFAKPSFAKPSFAKQEAPKKQAKTSEARKVQHYQEEEDYDIDEHIEVEEPRHSAALGKSVAKTNYLDAIEPEPVEFDWQRHTSFWQSRSLWVALSIVASFCIVAQFAWLKFDTYSLIPPYRTYYAEACELLGCELPQAIDNSKIKTANLVVRSHPKFQNALIVDAVLQNTARFEQRFPTLELVFTDVQEKIVAARRLEPAEYLRGELAGRSTMPVAQPVHIAIEIEDPGRSATGYKMTIAN